MNNKKRIAIFISGRGSNMEALVKHCQSGILKDLAEVVLVFSNKPQAKGLEIAAELGVRTDSIPSKGKKRATYDQEVLEFLEQYKVDYICLAGFMRVLSPVLVQAYPKGIINIHPADTQQHQGLGGYKWAFEQKLRQTKVTIHYVDEGLDTGAIIGQAVVDLSAANTLEEVEKAGLAVEHEFYSKAIAQLLKS